MVKHLQRLILPALLSIICSTLWAQNTISTQAISTPSLCPGSLLTVPFTQTGTYSTSNAYVVQLSNGGDYSNLITGGVSFNSGTGVYTVSATIPSATPAGTTYSVRVTATNPAVIGTPSTTKLTIKTKPAPLIAPVEVTDCQKADGSNNVETFISVTAVSPNTVTKLYFSNGDLYLTSSGERGFVVAKGNATYYLTQTVDGCESDKRAVKVTIKPKSNVYITPINIYGSGSDGSGQYGRVDYCLGDKSSSIKDNGILPIPDNITVNYVKLSGDLEFEGFPPAPKTDKVGKAVFGFITYLDGCASTLNPYGRLTVSVNPHPTKPVVSTKNVVLCQSQASDVLSATTTDASASLVWYGTNATGGTGSTTATKPSTANAGTFKYYVAQKLNGCESERAEITVEVTAKPSAPLGDSPQYDCQYRSGSANANTYTPYSTIYLAGLAPGSSVNFYDATGAKVDFTSDGYSDINKPNRGYKSPAYVNGSPKVVDYYVTQTINGCESDKKKIQLIIKAQIEQGPTVTATELISVAGSVGIASVKRVKLCQGNTAITFNDLPIRAEAGYHIGYCEVTVSRNVGGYFGPVCDNTTPISGSTVYETTTAGRRIFRLSSKADDPNTNCGNNLLGDTYIAVDIVPRPGKPSVSTSTISYCQLQASDVLTATTTDANASLLWYGTNATGGTGSTTAIKPSTADAGIFKYYVAQKLDGCESERAETTVEIKLKPTTPVVKSISLCQNENTPTLQVAGDNLLWYTNETGGSGSSVTPVISTSQAGQATYYVTQSLNGCESPRAALSITVNGIPGVPTVASVGPAYCQGTKADALTASGQNLKWYRESSGGTSLGENTTPNTDMVGSFTYYVSQSINGCESARSSITVKVNSAPAPPGVTNSVTYCQKATPAVLTASGNNLTWYDANGKNIGSAPTPTTDTPGMISYFVTQTADGCQSQRAEIKITTNPTPAPPTTTALAICQNEKIQSLSATGQNLLWYTNETGGSGVSTPPVPNTAQPDKFTYYVSQLLAGCEGPRAALTVVIKAIPPAPGVTQKDICQFTKPELVAATGNGQLKWYNPDGSKYDNTPIINTDKGATFTYQVSQTVDGCEGPRATLAVNVLTTPEPTVAKTTVELCQGATPQPLEAGGNKLSWTDPTGVVSATAPVPSTAKPSTKPEGDTYYVTQTGANGCESPKVPIRVFIQTAPTLSVGGTTTVNLGLEVPLKLTFTGVGPYQYKLSNGLTGMATKDTTVLVLPDRTTTYQVTEVTNKCGTGVPNSGSTATITVLVPGIQTLALGSTTLCAGGSLNAGYQTTGSFNAGNVFKLQLAKVETDSSKIKFVDMDNSQVSAGQLVGVTSASTAAGQYWVRAVATNPKIPILGSISPTVLTIRSKATATLTGNQSIYEGQTAKLSVALVGDGPWTLAYRDSSATGIGAPQTISTASTPYTFEVKPLKTTAYYLTSISNSCGNGTSTGGRVVVSVSPLLSIEDQELAEAVDIFPVPTTTALTIRIRGLSPKTPAYLELTDQAGHALIQRETPKETSTFQLGDYPSGIYILQIKVGERKASRRIVKL